CALPILIEGIGGVMVPLDDRHTVLDLIAAIDAPALLVAGSYLGTLSHTLTAAGMLAARGCRLAGIVISESAAAPMPVAETAAVLRRFVPDAPVVVVPRQNLPGSAPVPERDLAALAGGPETCSAGQIHTCRSTFAALRDPRLARIVADDIDLD